MKNPLKNINNAKKADSASASKNTDSPKNNTLTFDEYTYRIEDLDKATLLLAEKINELDILIHHHERHLFFFNSSRIPLIDELKKQLENVNPLTTNL